jgi:predicted PhzF superfamily epimerase YddE/YHI9
VRMQRIAGEVGYSETAFATVDPDRRGHRRSGRRPRWLPARHRSNTEPTTITIVQGEGMGRRIELLIAVHPEDPRVAVSGAAVRVPVS